MTPEEQWARASIGLASIANQACTAANMPPNIQGSSPSGMFGQGVGPKLAELLAYQEPRPSRSLGRNQGDTLPDIFAHSLPPSLFDAPVAKAIPPGHFTGADLKIDPTCTNLPEVYDPGVRNGLANALNLSQTAQSRNPLGPQAIEYGLSGGPRVSGYDVSPAYTDHRHNHLSFSNHGLPRQGDTFVAHAHPSFSLDQEFSPDDRKSHMPGITDILIGADGKLRCIPR